LRFVSVIIPVYNNQDTLERAILSVLNDPFVSEILVVDDGSKDNSLIVSQKFANKEALIKVLYHPNRENKGASASRNLGLANAMSEWIQFLDADDELLKGKLGSQFDRINPGISFIVGNSIHVFPDGKRHYRKSDNKIWKGLIRSKLGDTCANLWNKKYLLMVKGWNEELSSSQEYDLMFRLVLCNPYVSYEKSYLTLIHKTENSISSIKGGNTQRSKNWLELRDKIREHLVRNRIFHLLNKYYWSGAVGIFCNQNQIDFPIHMDKWFYKLYEMEISIKIEIYKRLN